MKTPIYLLNGTIFRTQENLTDLIEINEVFQDKNPIVAREKVFSKYQSYVDIFLESQGLEYESYEQAEKNLSDFIDSYKLEFVMNNPDLGQVDIDFDKGLFIYLVTDPTDIFTTKEGEIIYNKKHLIHFINNQFTNLKDATFNALCKEFEFYKINGYDIKNYKCEVDISGLFEDEKIISTLKTPIDFQKLHEDNLT